MGKSKTVIKATKKAGKAKGKKATGKAKAKPHLKLVLDEPELERDPHDELAAIAEEPAKPAKVEVPSAKGMTVVDTRDGQVTAYRNGGEIIGTSPWGRWTCAVAKGGRRAVYNYPDDDALHRATIRRTVAKVLA